MKILTLNTHSLVEDNYLEKLKHFVDVIRIEQPDIIAMQEVNQSIVAPVAETDLLVGYVPCTDNDVPVRQDNHAAQAARMLRRSGLFYHWSWLPGKIGYGRYDEGMAILVLNAPVEATDSLYISHVKDYKNWKTRKILGVKALGQWFYTVHMGWWDDVSEPFQYQWITLDNYLKNKKESSPVWLLGDFNSPAEIRRQGYDLIIDSGWHDTYRLAKEKDIGITVEGVIDGWREQLKSGAYLAGMRIDHIWSSEMTSIKSSKVMFNGIHGPVVSDHFGVMIETKEDSL